MQTTIQTQNVKVYIRFYNKKGHAIQMPSETTLQKIVQEVQLKSMIEAYNVILILKGKVIFDSNNPQSLNSKITLQDKTIIHVLDKRQLNYINPIRINLQIFVKNQNNQKNQKYTFDLMPQSTTKQIIDQIIKVQPNIDQKQITLLSAGRILQQSKTLSEYYIQNQGQIVCFVNKTSNKILNQIKPIELKTSKNQETALLQKREEQIKENFQDYNKQDKITSNKQIQTIKQIQKLQSQPKNSQQIEELQLKNQQTQEKNEKTNSQLQQKQNFVKFQKFPSLYNVNPSQLKEKKDQMQNQIGTQERHKLQKKQKIQTLLANQFQNQFYQPMLGDKSGSQRYEDQPVSPIEVTYPQYSRDNNLKAGDYLMIKGIADQQRKHNLDVYLHKFTGGNLDNLFVKHNPNHISKNTNDYLVSWSFANINQKKEQ